MSDIVLWGFDGSTCVRTVKLIFDSWSRSASRKILKSLQAMGANRGNLVPRFWPIDIDFIRLLAHAV